MVTSPATQRITVYKVLCLDCGHEGKIALQGGAVVDLDKLWCPRCVRAVGPMAVFQRGDNGRWVMRP